jgi:hypothetical protein
VWNTTILGSIFVLVVSGPTSRFLNSLIWPPTFRELSFVPPGGLDLGERLAPAGKIILPFLLLIARALSATCACWARFRTYSSDAFREFHWVIMSTVHQHGFHLHWLDLAAMVAAGRLLAGLLAAA